MRTIQVEIAIVILILVTVASHVRRIHRALIGKWCRDQGHNEAPHGGPCRACTSKWYYTDDRGNTL